MHAELLTHTQGWFFPELWVPSSAVRVTRKKQGEKQYPTRQHGGLLGPSASSFLQPEDRWLHG